jgi:hypothetical protein
VSFLYQTNNNMDLATQIETEKHVSRELAIKLSETAVELEETKDKVSTMYIYLKSTL